jgi:hypothetical protein
VRVNMPKKAIIRNHTIYILEENKWKPVVRLIGEIGGFYAFDILDENYTHIDYLALQDDGEVIIGTNNEEN